MTRTFKVTGKKPTPFLDLYKEWMEAGQLPDSGLCSSLPKHLSKSVIFSNIEPTMDDLLNLIDETRSTGWWGYDGSLWDSDLKKGITFTPLRQTIMLLCAAINDEL